MTINERILPWGVVVALTAALAAVGWFTPAFFPDTDGYRLAAASASPWGELRHPLYGWLLQGLGALGVGEAWVPALQYGLHLMAVLTLFGAARYYGVERRAALSLAGAAVLSQCLLIWGRAVLPEMLSVSLLILAVATLLFAARERWFWGLAFCYGAALGLSYTLRPVMLPAVAVLPLLFAFLAKMATGEWRWIRILALIMVGALPLLGQSAYRLKAVGDFNIVSFGGFGMTGMTAQLLTPDVLERLPEAQRPLAQQVLEAKQKAIEERIVMPLFQNSAGQPSFQATALDGFDALARNFDAITWGRIMGLRGTGESWVAFNARMGALNGAILRSLPERWLMWTAGASARLAGRLIVYNAAFVLASLAFAFVALRNAARTGTALAGVDGPGWTLLTLIIAAWVLSTTPLTVIAAFPALRYADTGGIMLAALPLYGLFLALGKSRPV